MRVGIRHLPFVQFFAMLHRYSVGAPHTSWVPSAWTNTMRFWMVDRYSNIYEEVLRMETTKTAPASPTFEQRPWGSYTVLDEGHRYKVKRLEILPGKRLSYQKHTQRTEHWMVVQGTASVTLEGHEITVETGGTMDVHLGAAHRITNPGRETLVLIEIQRGSYLGEDDIIRLQDDYGRAPASVQA